MTVAHPSDFQSLHHRLCNDKTFHSVQMLNRERASQMLRQLCLQTQSRLHS